MVNSYNYPDGVSCQLFFFFLLAVGARRDLNLAHRLPVDSNSFCKSNPKRNRCQDRIRAVPGEDRRASQILANLGQTSPLFFFCYFFRLARRRKGGTARCPKPRGNPFSTPHQGLHVWLTELEHIVVGRWKGRGRKCKWPTLWLNLILLTFRQVKWIWNPSTGTIGNAKGGRL